MASTFAVASPSRRATGMGNRSPRQGSHRLDKTASEVGREMRQKLRKPDDPEQSRAFIEKAREVEADEKHSTVDKLMECLAKTKPEPRGMKAGRS